MRRGFTLIELLVVIAIIAVLAAILFPVFTRAREKAFQTTCINNQRQLVTAMQIYLQEHDDIFPTVENVWSEVKVDKGVKVCPTKSRISNGYAFNSFLAGKDLSDISQPTGTLVVADGRDPAQTPAGQVPNIAVTLNDFEKRHGGKMIAGFADGHVSLLTAPASIEFVPPDALFDCADFDKDSGTWAASNNPNIVWTPGTKYGNFGSGNQFHATQLAIPATGTLNGQPCMLFNNGGWLRLATEKLQSGFNMTTCSIFFVRTKGYTYFSGKTASSSWRLQQGGAWSAPWHVPPTGADGPAPEGLLLQSMTSQSDGTRFWYNGKPFTFYAGGNTDLYNGGGRWPATVTLAVGACGGEPGQTGNCWGGGGFDQVACSMGDIIIYTRALKAEERKIVENYLGGKFGISVAQ